MIESLPPGPVSVICDKHGGRNRYGDLLAVYFPEWFIEIRGEGRQRSSYRFGPADRRVEFCFRVGAESCLPAALASMASKYLRELAMRAFNDFWRRHVPDSATDGRLSARRETVSRRYCRETMAIAHCRPEFFGGKDDGANAMAERNKRPKPVDRCRLTILDLLLLMFSYALGFGISRTMWDEAVKVPASPP